MLELIFGTALILFGLPPDQGQIFTDGFEELTVYISTDRPDPIVWAINSNPGLVPATFVTSSAYLNDGKVAIACRMTWDGNVSPAITDYVLLFASFGAVTIPAHTTGVFAMLMPKTSFAVPAGVLVELDISGTVTTGRVVEVDDGSNIVVFTIPAGGSPVTPSAFSVLIYNDLNGSTWATAAQNFDVGEVWFGTLDQFQLATDPKIDLIDPTLMRRSHSNQPWPLFIKPYTQWTFNFTPMSNAKAYDSSSIPSFASVRYAISQAQCALVLPRIVNSVDLNQLTCFGKPESVGALAGVKDGPLWTASMVFGQAPP